MISARVLHRRDVNRAEAITIYIQRGLRALPRRKKIIYIKFLLLYFPLKRLWMTSAVLDDDYRDLVVDVLNHLGLLYFLAR